MERTSLTADPLIGAMLAGRYSITRSLDEGGMGAVYEATDHLGQRVAVKVPHRTLDPKLLARFRQEAQALALIRHPHVVRITDFGDHEALPFMVMEFLHGESLASRIEREGTLSVTSVVDLVLPIVSALALVHDKGILHRDLKPANIFVARDDRGVERSVLIDFGVARLTEDNRSAVTTTGGPPGTLAYCGPEKLERKPIGAPYDVFALGGILFYALSGEWFEPMGFSIAAITAKISPEALDARGVPPSLVAVILRCLAHEASARFATMRELGAALAPFAGALERLQWERSNAPTARIAPTAQVGAPPRISTNPRVDPPEDPASFAATVPLRAPPVIPVRPLTLDSNQLAVETTPRTEPPRSKRWGYAGLALLVAVCGTGMGVAFQQLTQSSLTTAVHRPLIITPEPALPLQPSPPAPMPAAQTPTVAPHPPVATALVPALAQPVARPAHPTPDTLFGPAPRTVQPTATVARIPRETAHPANHTAAHSAQHTDRSVRHPPLPWQTQPPPLPATPPSAPAPAARPIRTPVCDSNGENCI